MNLEPSDLPRFLRGVDRLAAPDVRVAVGLTHGDPASSNVIRMQNDQLGLVDWERAGRNPLGLDACRLVAALDDPAPPLAILGDGLRELRLPRVGGIEQQAAIAMLALLPTWARQARSWQAGGRASHYRVRNRRRLQLLERLVEV